MWGDDQVMRFLSSETQYCVYQQTTHRLIYRLVFSGGVNIYAIGLPPKKAQFIGSKS
jgi:hypothetical protein